MVGTFVPFHNPPKRKDSARVGWVVAANGCHIWQGARTTSGYGYVKHDGRMQHVHRLRYEREVGPIPDGMDLDHFVCDRRACCNPEHVRPASRWENILRGDGVAAAHAAKTRCPQGHPYSGDNLYVYPSSGARGCRECIRTGSAAYHARNRDKVRARKRATYHRKKATT